MIAHAHVSTSLSVTVTAVTAQVTNALKPNVRYVLITSTVCWVAQGATLQTAAIAGAGSMQIPANVLIFISGSNGAFLSVIGTAGTLTVTAIEE